PELVGDGEGAQRRRLGPCIEPCFARRPIRSRRRLVEFEPSCLTWSPVIWTSQARPSDGGAKPETLLQQTQIRELEIFFCIRFFLLLASLNKSVCSQAALFDRSV